MTSGLSNFAARLREFMTYSIPVAADVRRLISANPKSEIRNPKSPEPPHGGCYEETFDALALELFALQFAHNAPYQKFCEARRATPQAVTHWTQIPAVPTAAFKEFEFTCLATAGRTTIFHSSGTSGQRPSRHFHNTASLGLYEASLLPWFRSHLLPDCCPSSRNRQSAIADLQFILLTPPSAQAPHSSLVHMFEVVRRELRADNRAFVVRVEGDGSWSLDLDAARELLRNACDCGLPLVMLGAAFSFVQLLDGSAERHWRVELPPGSRVMETGGYKGRSRSLPKAQLHALITQWLGVPPSHIVCEYGMSELSSQAYDGAIQSENLFLPHPGPLPKERENDSQPVGESGAVGNVEGRTLLFPLPGGEGQGEGKRSVGLPDALPTTRCFRFPPWARVQIVSPETNREVEVGETGLIRVFDLANVFSVLAIQTEDLGIRRGDGFELLGRAELTEPRGCSLMTV